MGSDGGLTVDNFSGATTYDLEAAIVNAAGWEHFYHAAIEIPSMTRHRIWLNWLDYEDKLSIDVDYGIDGSIDETIWIDNQLVPPCPADIDGDDIVNVTDLLLLLAQWGTTDPTKADITGPDGEPDGIVDVHDLLALLAAWGPCL